MVGYRVRCGPLHIVTRLGDRVLDRNKNLQVPFECGKGIIAEI